MNRRLPKVAHWLTMSQDQVLDKFMILPHAYQDGQGQNRFVYVPGSRSDRVLLVAHADTVWGQLPINVGYADGILFSKNRLKEFKYINKWNTEITKYGVGLGADDRAGCAIVWELRKLGHSILITSGEEEGCIASKRLIADDYWSKLINTRHSFAVQFDRRGFNDIVFYNVGTKKFAQYVKENTGYKPVSGNSTDIKILCKDICGVNMSCGYHDEHNSGEKLVIDQWMNTLQTAKNWLSQPKIETFPLDPTDKFEITYPTTTTNYGQSYHSPYGPYGPYGDGEDWNALYQARQQQQKRSDVISTEPKSSTTTVFVSTERGLVPKEVHEAYKAVGEALGKRGQKIFKCRVCGTMMSLKEWAECHFKCYKCKCEI